MAKTPQETLAVLRQKIAERKMHISEIENAPIPETEAIEQFRQRLDSLAESGREHLTRYARAHCWPVPVMGLLPEARTIDRDGGSFLHSHGIQSVMAASDYDRLMESGIAEIAEFYRQHPGMTVPAGKRAELLAKARAELFGLEVDEERIVTETGHSRRSDADPAAILGVKPGAPLPWDYRSLKANNITIEAENARGALVGIREELESVSGLLHRLEGDVAGFRPDSLPERLVADLEINRRDIADLREQLATRQETARNLNTIAARCRHYVQSHRSPRPASTGTLKPLATR